MYPKKIIHVVTRTIRLLTGVSFILLIAVVSIQITGRFIGSSPVWTEELTRFALLYMTAFGAGLSLLSGDMINVDVICNSLPKKWSWYLRVISLLLTIGMGISLMYSALGFYDIGLLQTSPALGLRMNIVHATMVLLLCSLTIGACILLTQSFSKKEH